ncbi:hypothetical protein BGW39_006193 [Mortierella sp. 14UC]|nr:hypothetical protein BGW39_006193 [Mortierella sp. 14UC]
MNTHPLTLPEIVLTIGRAIPLWVPEQVRNTILLAPEQVQETTLWVFKPKDLAAAVSVNRLFHTLLNPILWSTFAYPADRSYSGIDALFHGPSRFYQIKAETITKNSFHLHYVDLTLYSPFKTYSSFKLAQLQLNCTRLQELRLSESVSIPWATQLIRANPGLRLVHWVRGYSRSQPTTPSDLTPLNSLCRLRSLQLVGWKLNAVALYHVLDNNANSLEDLEFGYTTNLLDEPCMNDAWSGLTASSLARMTPKNVAAATKHIQGRSLLLPKLRKLCLSLAWSESSDAICSLVRAFPSLEMLIVGNIDHKSASKLAENLQGFCPNLRSLEDITLVIGGVPTSHPYGLSPSGPDAIIHVIDACAPGTLAHINLNRRELSTKLANALLRHRDGIETLELKFNGQRPARALRNVRKVLNGCCDRLKKFSLIDSTQCEHRMASGILEALKRCQRLETLKLVLFPLPWPYASIEHGNSDSNNEDEEGEIVVGVDDVLVQDGTPGTVFQLPSGWRQIELIPSLHSLSSPTLTDAFKSMVFEAVADLSEVQTFDLNRLRFERISSSSSE